MTHRYLACLGFFCGLTLYAAGCAESVVYEDRNDLDGEVRKVLKNFKGLVGIYAKHLSSGWTYRHNADELFCTASVFKVPVMVDLFRRAEEDNLDLRAKRKVSAAVSRHGTGVLKYLEDDPELSLLDYCRLMIIYSDNIATDTLMEIADPPAVTRTMERLGLTKTRVSGNVTKMHYGLVGVDSSVGSANLDEVLIERARAGELVQGGFADRSLDGNVTTPEEMGALLEMIYRGEAVSSEASAEMLEIMKETRGREMIPRYLPPETEVAHKTGGTWRVKADVGIVFLDYGPVVMSLFVYCDPGETRKGRVLAEIAGLIARWGEPRRRKMKTKAD